MEFKLKDIEVIYHTALEKEAGPKRSEYLDAVCGGDTTLRKQIEALLKANEQAADFLEKTGFNVDINLDESPISESPGTVIGRYKLLEKIGEGGMAVVYMAEQEKPIRRKVALKIIKLGMDTKSVIARFEVERQALAMMDHPNIAKVLDAGATETGRPYFVMDLVPGLSITEYCDKNRLSIKERLKLFISVCNAVQHAHQKGIIHRDVKPSNVMVTQHDGRPVPKVIDFGIAKAINQKLTEKTLFTRYAHIIGTPAYMSPEQAELSDLDVDTRTDIYSLGVLLYELLTGNTPFSEEQLREAGYLQMQKIICQAEPTKPSTKLSTLGKALTDVARLHGSSPELMPKLIRGDLDWIVMKSLEKDRSRRYETANMLALDIRRHLEHEPVTAGAPGTTYRVHKFLRRHRSQTIAALAMLIIAGAVVIILSMWNQDRLQLAEAEGFRHRGILSQAREQYAKAEREAALETLKPILGSMHVGPEARLLNAGILIDNRRSDEAVAILSNLLNERPEVAGSAHSLLARILWESESPNAEKLKEIDEHRQKAEALLPETAEAYFLRAMTALTVKEQLASLDKALQLDPSHYESRRLRAFTYYASRKYNQLHDDALVMTILRPRDSLGYSLRAVARRELSRYREAIADYDIALALTARDGPAHADLCAERSETLLRMGDYPRVIAEASVETQNLASAQYHVFCALTALGEYDKATALFREIISPGHEARHEFQDWCAKYVFDTLDTGRSWHPPDREPVGAAFLPMVEAEETYRVLSAKGRRVTTNGFGARWSPDGKKLAFSLGVQGYSGVAVFDPATGETDLLIVPGKDPRWSPDGKYIAFVRDDQSLRLDQLAAVEERNRHLLRTDKEVWLMKPDGTEPRHLARGSWPSWSKDSTRVYYHSRLDNALCSISIEEQNAEPKRIMACSNGFPSVSPDNQRVAYLESTSLIVKDLASQAPVAEWPVPFAARGGVAWSPTGRELCIGGGISPQDRVGLWVCALGQPHAARVLGGRIGSACWSPRGTNMAFHLGPPYFEIWAADLDPNVTTIGALGPGQTLEEHFHGMVAFYTRRIEADPNDAYAYSRRALYHDYLGDRARATADMRQWSAFLSGGSSSDSQFAKARSNRRILSGPFGYQLVFSVEERENNIQVPRIALGQKGRCNMKSFQIPMLSMSLLGLCLLSGLNAPTAHADFTFGEPVNLGPTVNSAAGDISPCVSHDGLELYFSSYRGVGFGLADLWVSTRPTPGDDWGPPRNLGPLVNSPSLDLGPSLSGDGLELYFQSNRIGGLGALDIWVTKRATKDEPWDKPENLGPPVNSAAYEYNPSLSSDGLALYFAPDSVLAVTTRATKDDPWEVPVPLSPVVNNWECQDTPWISSDGLLLVFTDNNGCTPRPGGLGGTDIWFTKRATKDGDWEQPVNLGPPVNTVSRDDFSMISPDGSTLYFSSTRPGGYGDMDLWQAPIIPIVDFNGDGIVDIADVCIMIEHWHTDYSLCDIGPMPWGDGFVDAQDLTVLAEHLFEASRPTAHWKLDEEEGSTAYDTAGPYDADLHGGPVWQPSDGKEGGALQLDGTDDYVSTPFILDPATGSFSVFAWIKSGARGQVIISQNDETGTRWLWTDPSYGRLITWLMHPPFDPLISERTITDEQWHHIGLVYDFDTLLRRLYVDGVKVAQDTDVSGGVGSNGGLYFGAEKTLGAGTFFSGLIDDVRIYDQALSAEEIAALAQ